MVQRMEPPGGFMRCTQMTQDSWYQRARQPNRGRSVLAPAAIPWRGRKDIAYRLFVALGILAVPAPERPAES